MKKRLTLICCTVVTAMLTFGADIAAAAASWSHHVLHLLHH